MTEPQSFTVRLAQTAALLGTSSLSGAIASASRLAVPALLAYAKSQPSLAAKQWKIIYDTGRNTVPPLAILTTLTVAYLTSQTYISALPLAQQSPRFYLYAVATTLVPGIIPFTVLVMAPTNNTIESLAVASEGEVVKRVALEEGGLEGLLKRWRGLNYTRSVIMGCGAICVALATVWY